MRVTRLLACSLLIVGANARQRLSLRWRGSDRPRQRRSEPADEFSFSPEDVRRELTRQAVPAPPGNLQLNGCWNAAADAWCTGFADVQDHPQRMLRCHSDTEYRQRCRLTCAVCDGYQRPPPHKMQREPFMAFLQRCFVLHEFWQGYTKIHRWRFWLTTSMAARYLRRLQPDARVMHLGDGQGHMRILLRHFFGLARQDDYDLVPSVAAYKDSGRDDTCQLAQAKTSLASLGDRGGWSYSAESRSLNLDSVAPWAVPAGTYDVAVALETVEHLERGPQHFFLNVARALRPGGLFIVTTPNSLSFRTLAQWLRGLNPNSYHPFRCFSARGVPTTESADANCSMHIGHTKEYTPNELHGAFVNAGFQIIDAQTFSPYFYQLNGVRQNMSLRPSIWRRERDHGEVHFVVGRKVGCHRARPCRRGYPPAYEFDDVISEADPLFVPS
jgi:SAM-dependent methyltransferase